MTRFKLLSLVVGLAFFAVPFVLAESEPRQVTLRLEGAGTVPAESHAEAALKAVPGVKTAKVSYARRTAAVAYDPEEVKIDQLIAALDSVGFSASPAQAKHICPTCQATYEAAGACLLCEVSLNPISE